MKFNLEISRTQKSVSIALIIACLIGGGYFIFLNRQTATEEDIPEEDRAEEELLFVDTSSEAILPVTNGTYRLNANASQLMYSASRIVGESHTGSVPITEGAIAIQDGRLASGDFVIDMTRISESENNETFLRHVLSDDFFNVKEYPIARFSITKLGKQEGAPDDTYEVIGDLTILDTTRQISFPAKLSSNENTAQVQAVVPIDRTRWGITYDSGTVFSNLGDKAIKDEVLIALKLQFDISQP